jgi:hypothetical protein
MYTAADVANETTVVDGFGQRLTLNVENIRGGGGQRRISLFSPFWLVNTTFFTNITDQSHLFVVPLLDQKRMDQCPSMAAIGTIEPAT